MQEIVQQLYLMIPSIFLVRNEAQASDTDADDFLLLGAPLDE